MKILKQIKVHEKTLKDVQGHESIVHVKEHEYMKGH